MEVQWWINRFWRYGPSWRMGRPRQLIRIGYNSWRSTHVSVWSVGIVEGSLEILSSSSMSMNSFSSSRFIGRGKSEKTATYMESGWTSVKDFNDSPSTHHHHHHLHCSSEHQKHNQIVLCTIHHWPPVCMKYIRGYPTLKKIQYTGTWGIYHIGQPAIKHCRLDKRVSFWMFPTIYSHVWLKRNKKRRLARRDSMHVINGKKECTS